MGTISRHHEMPLNNILAVFLFSPSSGNLYILVVVDYVSKWVETAPLPDNNEKWCDVCQEEYIHILRLIGQSLVMVNLIL